MSLRCQSLIHHVNCPKFVADAPEPKPPIYSVEVIEVACRALEVIDILGMTGRTSDEDRKEFFEMRDGLMIVALRMIRDGLASHEKAIRGEP